MISALPGAAKDRLASFQGIKRMLAEWEIDTDRYVSNEK